MNAEAPGYGGVETTEGVAMSSPQHRHPAHHVPGPDEPSLPELEDDENIAPRPEEEIADILRAKPDVEDHREGRD